MTVSLFFWRENALHAYGSWRNILYTYPPSSVHQYVTSHSHEMPQKKREKGKKSQRKSSSIRINFCGNLFLTARFFVVVCFGFGVHQRQIRRRGTIITAVIRQTKTSHSLHDRTAYDALPHIHTRTHTRDAYGEKYTRGISIPQSARHTLYAIVRITHKVQFNFNGMEMRHIHMGTITAAATA